MYLHVTRMGDVTTSRPAALDRFGRPVHTIRLDSGLSSAISRTLFASRHAWLVCQQARSSGLPCPSCARCRALCGGAVMSIPHRLILGDSLMHCPARRPGATLVGRHGMLYVLLLSGWTQLAAAQPSNSTFPIGGAIGVQAHLITYPTHVLTAARLISANPTCLAARHCRP